MTNAESERVVDSETRVAIEQLVAECMWRLDHGQADRLWELYTEDGTSHGPMGTMTGREEIRAWGAKRVEMPGSVGRHHLSGIHVAWIDGELTGCIQYSTYRDSSENPLIPASVGEFNEVYRLVDGEWLFQSRKITPLFGGPNAAAHARRVAEAGKA